MDRIEHEQGFSGSGSDWIRPSLHSSHVFNEIARSIVKAPMVVAASMLVIEVVAIVFRLADSLILALRYGALFAVTIALLLIYAVSDIREFVRSGRAAAFVPSALNLLIAIAFVALSCLLASQSPDEEADAIPSEHGITLNPIRCAPVDNPAIESNSNSDRS